ncbi:MAG: cysteine synthase A [Deltaproteobacteria bacterium]
MKHSIGLMDCIGNTPLVKLHIGDRWRGAQIWGKLEFMNPGGSSKDRICSAMVRSMAAEDVLKPGGTIVEASAGNTAISLAMVCAALGYSLKLVMPESIPLVRRRFLSSYGAEIELTPSPNGMKGAVHRAMEIQEQIEGAVLVNQFENPMNPEIHRRTTAVEILRDLGGPPDSFVAGVGTGGTLTGVGETLKTENPQTRVIAVEPVESSILSGGNPGPHRIPGIGAGFIPKVLNTEIIDDVAVIEYEEAAKASELLAAENGIDAGLSSGAAFAAAMREAERLDPTKTVVTILCDSGERYLCFAS